MLLAGQVFQDLFDSFSATAYRQESRDRYNSPDEESAKQRFFAGSPDLDYLKSRPWLESIREKTRAGRQFRRVRIVSVPLLPYSRYALWSVQGNIAAGEDIRYLARSRAEEIGLPMRDAWLFDSARVALLHFDEDDRLLGAEMFTDSKTVAEFCEWRDVAWENALTRDSFVESLNQA
jgi:hypothetical protein